MSTRCTASAVLLSSVQRLTTGRLFWVERLARQFHCVCVALRQTTACSVRINEAHGVSERFRAALEASAARQRGPKSGQSAEPGGSAAAAGSWGSVWKALIRVHGPIMFRVSTTHEHEIYSDRDVLDGIVCPSCALHIASDSQNRPSKSMQYSFRKARTLLICKKALHACCIPPPMQGKSGEVRWDSAHDCSCLVQSSFLIFVSELFAFAGPVLLQQLLQFLEDRSSISEGSYSERPHCMPCSA